MPTPESPSDREIALVLEVLDRGYDRHAWHGPNLKGSIRGLVPDQAAWRPAPGRHSIAEQVVHCAYWKYTVRRRLRGDDRGSFALKGSNWFPIEVLSPGEWKSLVALLDAEHRQLRELIAGFPPAKLHEPSLGGRYQAIAVMTGIAAHDVYHAGQIQILKRLQARTTGTRS